MTTTCNPGDILAGKYRVERVLGAGGMGVVVQATHLALGQPVALKFMLPEAMAAQEAMDRFMREARAASRLRSEHVATVQDVGTLENGAPYIVMQYLEGTDLSHLVRQNGPLPPEWAAEYVVQTCAGLAEAHQQGIVHRDLKPANLFLTRRVDGNPLVKILDFGISKVNTGVDAGMTRTQSVMGSPHYMSPEQVRSSRQADTRSDIWSLGVVLYELVSSRVPFQGESFTDICVRIAVDQPQPLISLRGHPLDDVVIRCLQKDPGQRYQSVAELALALAPFVEGGYQRARSIAQTLGVQLQAPQPGGYGSVGTGQHPRMGTSPQLGGTANNLAGELGSRTIRKSRKLPVILAASLIAVGIVVGVVVAVTRPSKPDTTVADTPAPAPGKDPTKAAATPTPTPTTDPPKPTQPATTSQAVAQPTPPAPTPTTPTPTPTQTQPPAPTPPPTPVAASTPADAAPPTPTPTKPPITPTKPPSRPTHSTKPTTPATASKPATTKPPASSGEDDLDIRK